MGKTISFVKGKGSISHNNRDFIAENVDRDRTAWNVEYIKQPIREAYDQLFGGAIAEYNAKQKRKDRQVTDYLNDIKNSRNGEKQFYEIVVQIGKKDDTGVLDAEGNLSVDAKAASEILDEYARSFQERNPNLYLFNAVLHMDEATPHLHLDYIPVAHGYKTKMHTRNSLTKALQEMGIVPATSQKDNETVHWQAREREYLTELCKEHEIEIEILGVDRDSYSIPEYKQAMREKENAEAEIEILHSEKIEIEETLSQIGEQLENGKEEIQDQKEVLEEINTKIAEAEKRIESKTKAMDQIISAGKSVEKEIKEIKAKALIVPNLFGGEQMVKIPKSTFDKMLSKYYAAGTFENLYKQFEKALDAKQKMIDKLTKKVNDVMEKIKEYSGFISFRGLDKEFEEFRGPKKILNYLAKKKEEVKRLEQDRGNKNVDKKKDRDVAI